jgi:hypothetical protein
MNSFPTLDLLPCAFEVLTRPRSLAVIELQIVTVLFFRYFNVKSEPSMKPEYMAMKVAFSGSPKGEKVLLNL